MANVPTTVVWMVVEGVVWLGGKRVCVVLNGETTEACGDVH